MWMRKQDSTAFVISSLVALRTADGEAPAIVIVEAKNLTSSLELGSALLKWLPLNASTQPKLPNH